MSWLEGVAGCRGAYWAESVVRKLCGRPIKPQRWPQYDESARARELALRRVADMSRDARLRELLARACLKSAAEEYERLVG